MKFNKFFNRAPPCPELVSEIEWNENRTSTELEYN